MIGRIQLGVVICLLVSTAASADSLAAGGRIPSADLLEDVDVLQRVYETAHPGLYRYSTKEQMDGHFAALRAEFSRDRTLAEAFLAISQFLAMIRCGHTYANFVNQDDAAVKALIGGRNRVPFHFRWIEGRMIVTRDLSAEHALGAGTQVLSINEVKAGDILAKLMTVARADGANDAKRVALLEVQGRERYETFDVFFSLFYPSTAKAIRLQIRTPGAAQPTAVAVAPLDWERRNGPGGGEAKSGAKQDPLWKFETLEGGVAYLSMPSWVVYNSKWDWQTFLDKGMDDLIDGRAPALIVDLRGNEGGSDVGNALIARIAMRDVRGGGYLRCTRYRTMPAALNPYLATWDKSFRDWGVAAVDDREGFFRLTKYDDSADGTLISPKGRRFTGRVVVLIDASNSSATFQFAQMVKTNGLGTLVGRTTGGSRRGINGGAFFFLTLPNSRIEVDLPLIATFPGSERPTGKAIPFARLPDSGVEPDLPVSPSAQDIARGSDAELNAAKSLLRASAATNGNLKAGGR